MYFYDPAERQGKDLFPGIVARTFWGEKILLGLVDVAPNGAVPPHRHPHEQAGIVLEGQIEFTIGGETKMLGPGAVYVIPSNVEHSAKVGSVPTRVLDIFSPVRDDWKY